MYSTSEAGEILGLSQDHVRLLARTGVIEAKKLGHDWVVLNLDYKRKRKIKGTKYVSLAPPGRQAIIMLEQQGRKDEAEILRFLISGETTVQQITDNTHIQSSKVRIYLRQFKRENWIKEKRIKEESPEKDKPERETLEKEGFEEDRLEEETLEKEGLEEDKLEEETLEKESLEEDKLEEETPKEERPEEDEPADEILKETSPEEDKPKGILLVYDF